jgi:hypothetical protein
LQDGESDRIFTVRMKPKIFKKLTEHGFTEWVAAITGEIGSGTETGFELVNAAVQVFEKKAREGEGEGETSVGGTGAKGKAEVEPKGAMAQTQKDGTKKKGLLDGVKLT